MQDDQETGARPMEKVLSPAAQRALKEAESAVEPKPNWSCRRRLVVEAALSRSGSAIGKLPAAPSISSRNGRRHG